MRQTIVALAVIFALPRLAFAQNQPPVSDAGPDRHAYTHQTIVLEGVAADAENDPIVYWAWSVEQVPAGAAWSLLYDDMANPYFTAFTPGDFVLSLVVGDASGFSLPDFVTLHVADNLPPVAVASATPTTVTVGGTVCFDGSRSYDPEGAPLRYLWDFADGSPYQYDLPQVCHAYTSVGTFAALLRVTDERNATDSDILRISVLPPANHPPVASPTATPNNGSAALTVAFNAGASDPDGDPLTYSWNFGDPGSSDNASTLANPGHTYETAGTFVAWLTVSDGKDAASYSLTITVSGGVALSTRYASVLFWNKQKTTGAVNLWADFAADLPAGDDVVAVTFDKIQLFAVPFSSFRPGLAAGSYWLLKWGLIVRLDFVSHQIFVTTPKIALTGLDNANGVDVELLLGDGVAVENIRMTPASGNRLVYRRADTTGDPL